MSNYELKKEGTADYLVNILLESRLLNTIDRANEFLPELVETLKQMQISINDKLLVDIISFGNTAIYEVISKEIKAWAKNSPIAQSSIKRMTEEKFNEIPKDLRDKITEIKGNFDDTLKSEFIAVFDTDFDIEEDKITINKERVIKRYYFKTRTEITAKHQEQFRRLKKLLDDITALEGKGLIMFSTAGSMGIIKAMTLTHRDTLNQDAELMKQILEFQFTDLERAIQHQREYKNN